MVAVALAAGAETVVKAPCGAMSGVVEGDAIVYKGIHC